MKVSVITATYNSARTIQDTLRSLEQQTYHDIEYIIVDGASSDETLELVKRECSRVTTVISEPDRGIYDALNKGILAATGDVIGFLHSDDVFATKESVQQIVNAFVKNKTDAVYGDLQYVSASDPSKIIRLWKSGEYSKNKLKRGWMPPHPTFYMKREIYEKLGVFDLSYKIAGDYDSLLRYLWVGNVSMSYCEDVLIKMRIGGASNRSLKNIWLKSCEDSRALKNSGLSVVPALFWKNVSKIPQFIFKKQSN
ncbi:MULTISPECIES: glycosyltransferase family 2 protein [Shewanella]|uniref:glycosyltransferase family 2 protein n=1 Tax=Shewanella TaxID=22 RepID=UPI000C48B7C1|nr:MULTISPECIES: glycosyltransferase family 2 protein [Shewanella]NCQ44528.1 glycosyltransferase [Shewanella frigidimarina]NCO72191.1 glycosyltransferase [Shewanella vesiculosa]NCP35871.1 glycosyltransferase [Shewanella vesiculosa]NCP68742.1 glycosyltransferase [Shewanella vesiculosa]NCP73535.1 glycosyltransferase [Shewanella vesiculosa]